jgi:hypothetical protein
MVIIILTNKEVLMNTINTSMYNALVDAAYTAWDHNVSSAKINGAKVIFPANDTSSWAGHLLTDVLRIEDAAFAAEGVVYLVKDYRELPACVVMHEVGHCVEPTAKRPAGYVGDPHDGKGARYEKRADLYALRWAVNQDDPGKLISTFADYTMDYAAPESDGLWRACLMLRYVRRYYP